MNRFYDGPSIAEIKAKAKERVHKEGRGVSVMSLIKTARSQLLNAKEQESQGNLKGALSSYIMAAGLMKMAVEANEFKQDTKGVIRKEWESFLKAEAGDLLARTSAVEEKLKAIEQSQAREVVDQDDGPIDKPGASIADRVRALQDNGLSVGTSKRFSREVANLPTPPTSPSRISTSNTTTITAVPPTPISPSPHTLVSLSSFGPPSPSSSPSSPPPIDLSGFSQAFPSIEELDENPAFSLPSVPTGIPSDSTKTVANKALRNGDPLASFRDYAVQIERPASTPIPPMGNNFNSRPASPASKASKLSGLSRSPIPVKNSALPSELLTYIREYNVLLIDVRNREDFNREHIKAPAVVCVEATVLKRAGIDADSLEASMVVAPRTETSLFENRGKFDLVAVYDQSSTTFGDDSSPLSILVSIISERAFKKILKRMPMMLVGGLDAWKKEFGSAEVVRGEGFTDVAPKPYSPPPTSPNPNNPFTNGMFNSLNNGNDDPHQVWTPRPRPAINGNEHKPTHSLDISGHSRSAADYTPSNGNGIPGISRRPALTRNTQSISISRSKSDINASPIVPAPLNGSASAGSITYPTFAPTSSSTPTSPPLQYDMPSPPQASINSSHLTRRRSDYVDQSAEAVSALQSSRHPIDYPELSMMPPSAPVLRPPPVAASPALERHSNRQSPYQPPQQQQYTTTPPAPKPPRIASDYPVPYWGDMQIGISGLKNLGNTCYMNAPIQCLSATVPFSSFFTDGRWKNAINFTNKMGSQGKLVQAFAKLLRDMWGGDLPYLTPVDFRRGICQLNQQYIGSDQHDSQEFLSFLLDGIHEDLNRIMVKQPVAPVTPEQEEELNRLPPIIASDREWRSWKARNDSLIVDYFQGQFRSKLQCLTCKKTSTTYNVFSILQLPIPYGRSSKVSIGQCLNALFNDEILEKDDAWDCPQCKTKRRASKTLSLARLPPILLIHFKRFEANGRFSDKVDTFVEFPMKGLDLTNYMPPPLPPGADQSELNGGLPMSTDDPRTQLPPYRYDLYGVTNHYGNLSSGHYTAYIASRGGWLLCDDSSVKPCDPKQVVNQKAYVLFYKRVRAS
ncbi:hypothetical protein H1R20_g7424, partial [Candolleomyces eurysporus]